MNVLEREQAQLARLRELRDQIVTALAGEAVEISPDITFGELAAVLPEKIDEAIRQGTGGIRAREIVKEEELGLTDGGAATVGGRVQVGDSAILNDEAIVQTPHVHRQTILDIFQLTDAFYATVKITTDRKGLWHIGLPDMSVEPTEIDAYTKEQADDRFATKAQGDKADSAVQREDIVKLPILALH